jgi:hypothetical protein
MPDAAAIGCDSFRAVRGQRRLETENYELPFVSGYPFSRQSRIPPSIEITLV